MVSLLAEESIQKMRDAGLEVGPGDFAENLTTRGIDLLSLELGTRLRLGENVVLELTQHGKECHSRCAIYYQAGDCVMPREGVFARVIQGGEMSVSDPIQVPSEGEPSEGTTDPGQSLKTAWEVGILTLSDKGSRGEREDRSGVTIRELLDPRVFSVAAYEVIPDEYDRIVGTLLDWAEEKGLDLILTTGGTGVSPRDVTPEATRAVLERELPGMAEAMRWASLQKTPHAVISRAVAGIRGQCLIVNLPGSPKAVAENLEAILAALPHAIEKIHGDPTECAT
jgi:molybdenum cofactor synthesis domain-containing protein